MTEYITIGIEGRPRRNYGLNCVFAFGKYRGKSIKEILCDFQYINWCLREVAEFGLDKEAQEAVNTYQWKERFRRRNNKYSWLSRGVYSHWDDIDTEFGQAYF